jgi:signal transduction histidine kinase
MSQPHPHLLLPGVVAARDAWLTDPVGAEDGLRDAIGALGSALGVSIGRVRISAAPLPDLDVTLGADSTGREFPLRTPGDPTPLGSARIGGDPAAADEVARALELVFGDGRARARASRAERQLRALDQAVRGISGVLDVERVLQLIVDRVRDLVHAQYAALGIVDPGGATIERFITSGISDEERERIGDLPHGRGLLGLIIRENRTYRIPDIATHPERYGFPPNHPEMHAFLGMPITASGQIVGRLYLTNKIGAREFSSDDQELVEMFALHAGIAIENARLHDQVRRLAIVDERDRISRDLHDGVIQAIYAQTLALDDVPDLVTDDPDEAARRVDGAIDALHAVIRDIRNFIFGLRPVLLESGNLGDGLEHLATELRRNGGVDVTVDIGARDRLSGIAIETVAELLAITREALTNIARHANATRSEVRLTDHGDRFQLEITDDGRGFDASQGAERGHHGLANMRARADAIGATFQVDSAADAGTRIIIAFRDPARSIEG